MQIGWNMFPDNLVIRVVGAARDGMVHRVFESKGSADGEDIHVTECGLRIRQLLIRRVKEDVDCMACATLAATRAMDAEIGETPS